MDCPICFCICLPAISHGSIKYYCESCFWSELEGDDVRNRKLNHIKNLIDDARREGNYALLDGLIKEYTFVKVFNFNGNEDIDYSDGF